MDTYMAFYVDPHLYQSILDQYPQKIIHILSYPQTIKLKCFPNIITYTLHIMQLGRASTTRQH